MSRGWGNLCGPDCIIPSGFADAPSREVSNSPQVQVPAGSSVPFPECPDRGTAPHSEGGTTGG